jgi:succinate dehydrogenase subunit C
MRADTLGNGSGHVYTDYHPRWLRQRKSTYWWLEKPAYFLFILRELTCLPVAWFAVYLLLLIKAVVDGPLAYQQFMAWSATPWMILLNVVSFALLLFHAITFFIAAPQALVVHLGRTRVPGQLVLLGHYAAWLAASVAVIWLLARA